MKEDTSFDEVDYETAKQQYNSWMSKQSESLDEFIIRKRKIELISLVKKVIEAELNDKDKEIVRLHWYESKSVTQTAQEMGMDKSTVSRRLEKINDVIYDKLKYAVEYRFGKDYAENARVIVKSKDALCSFVNADSTCARIREKRISQGMTHKDVSDMTGISEKALQSIESGKAEATVTQIAKIAVAFNTSVDYLLFGSKERKCG